MSLMHVSLASTETGCFSKVLPQEGCSEGSLSFHRDWL